MDESPREKSFFNLIRDLVDQPDEQHTVQSIVDLAVASIPGCDWAGVTVRDGRRLSTPASTSELVDRIDELQYEFSQGPCIDAVWVDDTYVVDDLATETRWPRWAPAAHEIGIRSVLSVRLATARNTVGGLNLYAGTVGAFADDDVQVAHVYADHAAVALAVSHEVTTLQTALQTRHSIGAAQGILRHRHGLTMDQAFNVLVRVSRSNNMRLRDLAEVVVEGNGLPARFMGD